MSMDRVGLTLLLGGLALLPGCAPADSAADVPADPIVKGGTDMNGAYSGAPLSWWKPHPDSAQGFGYAQVSGVVADSEDRVLIGIRGDIDVETGAERPNSSNWIVIANKDGEIVDRWTQWDTMIGFPHQLYISPYDPERHIWVVDRGSNSQNSLKDVHEQILKFTNDGKQLVMRLRDPNPTQGKGGPVARDNPNPGPFDYGQASTMTFLPNGDFLVADGYQNGRIIRYNAAGELVSEFGSVGSGPGQFDLVHGVAVGPEGRIYTADRNNSRIEVFSADGQFIEEWPNVIDPVGVYVDASEGVWVVSAGGNRILKYNTNGQLLTYFGGYGKTTGGFDGGLARPHQLSVDPQGNAYVTGYDGPWLNKFMPDPAGDPSRLVGQPYKLPQ